MYVAPIDFEDVRHWFLNVNKGFHHLCLFLSGNGDYNEVINEEILRNRILIDRATGEGICYFFSSSFRVEGNITEFNDWNVRNRNSRRSIDNELESRRRRGLFSSLHSDSLREDACDYYHIRRTSLPALVFISKEEDVFVYSIQGFADIKALLEPLGIINDYLKDKRDIEYRRYQLEEKKHTLQHRDGLIKATTDAIPKSECAKKLIEEILDICARNGFEESSIKKMRAYPEKIRQIVSNHPLNDPILSDKLLLLKDCISQYRIVRDGRYPVLLEKIEELSGPDYLHVEDELLGLEKELYDVYVASINRLNDLNLHIDSAAVLKECSYKGSGKWLVPVLKAVKNQGLRPANPLPEDVTTLKCFIAGAKALEKERDAIISGINDQNLSNKHTKRRIECYTFKNFDSNLTKEGQQAAYDRFIKEEADIVIFILDEVVGGITKQEFSVAVEALKESQFQTPLVFVFSNAEHEGAFPNPDIQAVRDQVNLHHQYWIDYTDLKVLKLTLQLKVDPLYTKDIRHRS